MAEEEALLKRFNKFLKISPLRYPATYLLYNFGRHTIFPNEISYSLFPFGSGIIDGVMEYGFGGIPGAISEIKGRTGVLAVDDPLHFMNNAKARIERLRKCFELENFLLVTKEPEDPSYEVESSIWINHSHLYLIFREGNIELKSKKSLKQWLRETLFKQQAQTFHEDAHRNRDYLKKALIEQLKDEYRQKNLTLFIGAGLTKDSGGPSWDELIQELKLKHMELDEKLRNNVPEDSRPRISAMMKHFQKRDSLIDAQILAHGFGKKFVEIIKEIVYTKIEGPGATLAEIAKACKGGGIRSIVIYNWDDIIEIAFRNEKIEFIRYVDGRAEGVRGPHLYYVHGYLPKKGRRKTPIIFREKEYHKLYETPFNWANHTQVQYLRNSTCLFIGLSMTDPNLRRLLRISCEMEINPPHVAILKWPTYEDLITKSKAVIDDLGEHTTTNPYKPNENAISAIFRVQGQLEQLDFSEIGVNVLWLEKYKGSNVWKENPEILEEISKP